MAVIGVRRIRRGDPLGGGLSILVFVTAVIGIAATGVAADSGSALHIGLGVWERIGIWPQAAWLTVVGAGTAWDAVGRRTKTVATRAA
jgi:hypothetical protein